MSTDILIINGSPRKNKNCFKISQEISNVLNKNNISNKIFNIYIITSNFKKLISLINLFKIIIVLTILAFNNQYLKKNFNL